MLVFLRLLTGIIETSAHLYLVSVSSLCPLLSAKPSQLASWPRPRIDVRKPKRTWHNFESENSIIVPGKLQSFQKSNKAVSATCMQYSFWIVSNDCANSRFLLLQTRPEIIRFWQSGVCSWQWFKGRQWKFQQRKEGFLLCLLFSALKKFIILTWKERILALASAKQRFNSQLSFRYRLRSHGSGQRGFQQPVLVDRKMRNHLRFADLESQQYTEKG